MEKVNLSLTQLSLAEAVAELGNNAVEHGQYVCMVTCLQPHPSSACTDICSSREREREMNRILLHHLCNLYRMFLLNWAKQTW